MMKWGFIRSDDTYTDGFYDSANAVFGQGFQDSS